MYIKKCLLVKGYKYVTLTLNKVKCDIEYSEKKMFFHVNYLLCIHNPSPLYIHLINLINTNRYININYFKNLIFLPCEEII